MVARLATDSDTKSQVRYHLREAAEIFEAIREWVRNTEYKADAMLADIV